MPNKVEKGLEFMKNSFKYLLTGILIWITSCSSSNKQQSPSSPDGVYEQRAPEQSQIIEDKDPTSSVTLNYELGRDHYLFQVVSRKNIIYVKSYLDKQLLKEGKVSPEKYSAYFNKVKLFLSIPQTLSAKNQFCRGPFTVTLKSPDSTKISKGCRSNDDGALSRLVREGEFLLYSGN